MKTKKLVIVTIATSLLFSLQGQAAPRPNGSNQYKAIKVKNEEQTSSALASSTLASEGIDSAQLFSAMQSSKITQKTLQRFLDPNLSSEYQPLVSHIVQSFANLQSGLNTTRFSTNSNTSNIGDSLNRITELTLQKLNGQQTEISTIKMRAIAEVINNYSKSGKTEIDADLAKQQARDILNADTQEPVVKADQDPFEVIKKCR